ncbi:hypothetical protein VCRA217O317_20170 [Vibrio crassostreae]|nr:hypothetical protein VCRA2117O328_10271 [Vibrio crassostreae]CAK2848039.1 hypothetical protein VCRA217O317_20170 [Vibrio crassostreae]
MFLVAYVFVSVLGLALPTNNGYLKFVYKMRYVAISLQILTIITVVTCYGGDSSFL